MVSLAEVDWVSESMQKPIRCDALTGNRSERYPGETSGPGAAVKDAACASLVGDEGPWRHTNT